MVIFLSTLFIVISLLLIMVVLLQKGRGGGLGAAFGGIGSTAFGTRVGDVLTWVTIVLTALFLILAVGTKLIFTPASAVVTLPQFIPPAAPIAAAMPITLRTETAKAKIYYTIDGSEPTEKSSLFEKPILVEPGTMIRARAFRVGYQPSEIAVARYDDKNAAAGVETQPATTLPATLPAN